MSVEILDFEDPVVRTLHGTKEEGLAPITWDLREDLPNLLQDSPLPSRAAAGVQEARLRGYGRHRSSRCGSLS